MEPAVKNYSATSQAAVAYGLAAQSGGLVESMYEWTPESSVGLWRRVF